MRRTAIGAGWVIGWRMATRLIGLVSTLVLIRLLAPADFGLVALATTFAIAVDTLSELGVEDSLVREPKPTPALYATAFTLTLIRGLATAALITAVALPVAAFFDEPRLAPVLWALAVSSLVGAAENVGIADFRRRMEFDKEFKLQLLPRLVSLVVTIAAAFAWHSYWALVAGMLAGRMVRTLFSYAMHPWRPTLSLSAWRYLFGYTTWSWALSLAALVRDRMDAFVLGRTMDATAVGVYAIGEEIGQLPTVELVAPIGRSCFSSFAAARAAGSGLQEAYVRPIAFALMVALPAGIGISMVADPLVRLVLGERWLTAIPVIEVYGVIGALSVLGMISSTLLAAFGLLRLRFSITAGAVVLRLALIIPLVTQLGILGAALGALVAIAVEHSVFVAMALRRFGIDGLALLRSLWRIGAATGGMVAILLAGGLGWSTGSGEPAQLIRLLAFACATGAVSYCVILWALWRATGRPNGAEADLATLLRSVLARVRRR